MKFLLSRASSFRKENRGKPPLEGCTKIGVRNIYFKEPPKQNPNIETIEIDGEKVIVGREHNGYTIEINTIEELLKLGRIILGGTLKKVVEGKVVELPYIEIYDDYVE